MNDKNKKLVRIIRILADSMESHLDDTHKPVVDELKSKKAKEHIGGKKFHIKTVQEYAEGIKLASDLLN